MPTIVVTPEQRDLTEVTAQERVKSTLSDPNELRGVCRQVINEKGPFVVLMLEPANHYSSVHYHTSNEVLIVMEGRMLFNGQWCGPGTVIYIDEGEEYWHSTGEEPCLAALIRPGDRANLVPGADQRAAQKGDVMSNRSSFGDGK